MTTHLKKLIGALVVSLLFFGSVYPVNAQQNGTTLTDATKTASGFYERQIKYDWTVEKVANPTALTIEQDQNSIISYQISADGTVSSDKIVAGVRGQICVTNGGEVATENLAILDIVQTKNGAGPFADYVSESVDLSNNPVLNPGERGCYDYEFEFVPVDGVQYRNVAQITVTNHSGWLPGGNQCTTESPCPFGPEPKVGFDMSSAPAIVEIDKSAELSDSMTCPTGFTCTSNPNTNSWLLSGPMTITYDVTVHNDNATCGNTSQLINTASLEELDSGETSSAVATVNIYNGDCKDDGTLACTNTIGYWKNHSGFGPQADAISTLLPQYLGTQGQAKTLAVTNRSIAYDVLSMNVYGKPANGITKLYAQLLAAKLNIIRGADDATVATEISAADAFLASKNFLDWKSLSNLQKSQVLAWMSALDAFNNGLNGPQHCD